MQIHIYKYKQSINQSIVYLSNQPNRIFQLTKAFKVATPAHKKKDYVSKKLSLT